jgi:hypothetical protein
MSKDEENLISRLEETIKRLKQAQTKLNEVAERLSGSNPGADLLLAMAVRGQDIGQDIGKSQDQTAGTLTEYKRLYRECEVNRVNESVLKRHQTKVIGPLDEIMNKSFPKTVESHTQVATALTEGRKPEQAQIDTDRADLATLIFQLQTIRDAVGELLSLQKARDQLTAVINAQRRIGRFLEALAREAVLKAYLPTVPPAEITLAKKAKGTVKHKIDWGAFTDNLPVTLTAPAAGGLKLPTAVTVGNDKDDLEYEVEAGDVAGEFVVTVTPAVGKPTQLKVIVK